MRLRRTEPRRGPTGPSAMASRSDLALRSSGPAAHEMRRRPPQGAWGRDLGFQQFRPGNNLSVHPAREPRAGYTIVTRNVKDGADLGVSYLNPCEPLR